MIIILNLSSFLKESVSSGIGKPEIWKGSNKTLPTSPQWIEGTVLYLMLTQLIALKFKLPWPVRVFSLFLVMSKKLAVFA